MSDYQSEHPTAGCVIAALIAAGLAVWAVSSALRARDPNPELVRLAREASQRADEARKGAESARRSANTLRVVAIVLGATVPLVVAYLIYRLHARAEAGPEDMLATIQAEQLDEPQAKRRQELHNPLRRLIEPPEDAGGGGEGRPSK
jgi:hypothetical protein